MTVYPDSDKVGVYLRDKSENVIVRRSSNVVDYFDGETRDQAPSDPQRVAGGPAAGLAAQVAHGDGHLPRAAGPRAADADVGDVVGLEDRASVAASPVSRCSEPGR